MYRVMKVIKSNPFIALEDRYVITDSTVISLQVSIYHILLIINTVKMIVTQRYTVLALVMYRNVF
jgi:hypothetical protein